MTMQHQGAFAPFTSAIPSRLDAYIDAHEFDRPTVVLDTDRVRAQYHRLKTGLGRAHIHYAVKANPEPAVIAALVAEGSSFDAASRGEIELCLSQGAHPSQISFGNTVKRASDIAFAYAVGVRLFAADSAPELEKIAAHAPHSQVYIRLLVGVSEADWPLSRKFGCDGVMALELLAHARALGLEPVGLSFHVGSQTRRAEMWAAPLAAIAKTWHAAQAQGHDLSLLNIGGGFPAFYGEAIEAPTEYAANVMTQVDALFGCPARVMAEPGRGLVAEAGVIVSEVLLVSRKSENDMARWVYLDIGRFSGLAETEGEAIRYQLETSKDGSEHGPCILAGPSCDSADVMYEKRPVQMPLDLVAGDRVLIRNTGAYTTTYSSVGFNGFPPLDVRVI
jgi:ornithine decarboxylase